MGKITAPFRWAGSKAKLTSELFDIFKESEIYVEPFLGSGVVLFRLLQDNMYEKYIVNDINVSIISFYTQVKNNPLKLIYGLKEMEFLYNKSDKKEEFYYQARQKFNERKENPFYFWLLMKAGFNGLYRENSKGEYNVPFGYKDKIKFDEEQIYQIHDLIQNVEFYCMDYQDFIAMVIEKEYGEMFIYNDPPYCNSQKYTKDDFNNEELANYLIDLKCDVAISDVDSNGSNLVYKDFFKVFVKDVKRVINVASIQGVREVLYINYEST